MCGVCVRALWRRGRLCRLVGSRRGQGPMRSQPRAEESDDTSLWVRVRGKMVVRKRRPGVGGGVVVRVVG